ncbi:MAG: Mur ligase domain-containing protein [Patescibacteria group bacterium]
MVGIGGIGMSALAQMLVSRGHLVSGSDRESSPVTDMLTAKRIEVFVGQDISHLPPETELLIYSDAVPAENPARAEANEKKIKQISYFEMLGVISRAMRTIAVSGTHGKTTVTGMLAAILKAVGKEPTAIVGSIVKDWGSNFLAGSCLERVKKPSNPRRGENGDGSVQICTMTATQGSRNEVDEAFGHALFIVEACEYRDHLLELSPEILVITNIELDHTDFFPSLTALQSTFWQAARRVPAHGCIITDPKDPNISPALDKVSAKVLDYTIEEVPKLSLIGEFNTMNARAAKCAAKAAFPDISGEVIDAALKDFKGSWRRFEYKGETPNGALVYDDYAHHPTAVRKTIEAARERFPGKRIVVAFHPHLHSRTETFLQEFADALDTADRAIVAPIYEARTEKVHAVSNHSVAEAAQHVEALDSFDEIRDELLQEPEGTLIITMGAGDIYKVAEQIVEGGYNVWKQKHGH